MTYSRLLPCVILLAACSSVGADARDAGPDASDAGPTGPVLCDGTDQIRFAYQVAGGGPVMPGSEVLSENGFVYLLVSGTCHYWALQDVQGAVREGELSAAAAASFTTELRLGMWSDLPPQGPSCPDAPSAVVRFADDRYELPSPCPAQDAGAGTALADAVRARAQSLHDAGAPVAGSVRFVLVMEGADWSTAVRERAAPWPLAEAAADVALTPGQARMYQRGSSRRASGDEAAALRDVRDASAAADVRQLTGGFIPVVDGSGGRYQLYVRDAIPPENDQGLLPPF
jgi:hypothetical protein